MERVGLDSEVWLLGRVGALPQTNLENFLDHRSKTSAALRRTPAKLLKQRITDA
jgi:hypothetical protein